MFHIVTNDPFLQELIMLEEKQGQVESRRRSAEGRQKAGTPSYSDVCALYHRSVILRVIVVGRQSSDRKDVGERCGCPVLSRILAQHYHSMGAPGSRKSREIPLTQWDSLVSIGGCCPFACLLGITKACVMHWKARVPHMRLTLALSEHLFAGK